MDKPRTAAQHNAAAGSTVGSYGYRQGPPVPLGKPEIASRSNCDRCGQPSPGRRVCKTCASNRVARVDRAPTSAAGTGAE